MKNRSIAVDASIDAARVSSLILKKTVKNAGSGSGSPLSVIVATYF